MLCFSVILNAFLRCGFGRTGEPRDYNWSGLNQAIVNFLFPASRDNQEFAVSAVVLRCEMNSPLRVLHPDADA